MTINSLFIPFVFPNFDENFIREAFSETCDIHHIDMIAKLDKNGKDYNTVYIHIENWKDSHNLEKDIELYGSSKFYYDDQWFWIVLPNFAKKHNAGDRKIRINLGDSTPETKQTVTTPDAPKKIPIAPTLDEYFNKDIASFVPINLNEAFGICKIEESMLKELNQEQIDDINHAMNEFDNKLIEADVRYVQMLECDNLILRQYVNNLFDVSIERKIINIDDEYLHILECENNSLRHYIQLERYYKAIKQLQIY